MHVLIIDLSVRVYAWPIAFAPLLCLSPTMLLIQLREHTQLKGQSLFGL